MASAQVVEMLVANNSPSQDTNHPDDAPGFKPFSYNFNCSVTANIQAEFHIITLRHNIHIGICNGAAMKEAIWKGQSTGVWNKKKGMA